MKLRAKIAIQYNAEGLALPGEVFTCPKESVEYLLGNGYAEKVEDEKPAKKADAKTDTKTDAKAHTKSGAGDEL